MSTILTDILTCPVCLEPFTPTGDHRPCMLTCGHTFCQHDLQQLTSSSSSALKCPLCQQSHTASTFQTNYTIITLLSCVEQEQEQPPETEEEQEEKKSEKKKKRKKKKKKKNKETDDDICPHHKLSPITILQMAAHNLPQSEVDYVKLSMSKTDKCYNDATIREIVANNRLGNKICNKCLKKDDDTLKQLQLCEHCLLTWYCSARCRDEDWKKHQQWCLNPHAKKDDGPMRTVFVPCKSKQ